MKLATLMAAALGASCLFAKTVYVDCKLDDYTKADGKTPETAYETLQAAYVAAAAGDTLQVASGVYNKGVGGRDASGKDHWWGAARVKVGGKKVYFYAPEGAVNTVIEGAYGDDGGTGTGFGPGALKCVISEGDNPAIFEGFTLRKGRVAPSTASGIHPSRVGGAVHASKNGVSDFRSWPYFVDCVIEDCDSPESGALWGGSYVRCTFRKNVAHGVFLGENAKCLNCVFTENARSTGTDLYFDACTFVNNTFVNNNVARFYLGSVCKVYNNVFSANNATIASTGTKVAGNLIDNATTRAMVNPMAGDIHWRNAAADSVKIGDATYLGDDYIAVTGGVVAIDKYLDFDGVAIPTTGMIAAGAAQTGVDVAVSGAIEIKTDGIVYDGHVCRAGDYVTTTNWPELVTFTFNTNSGSRVVHYQLSYGDKTSHRMAPMLGGDDPIKLLPPKDATKGVFKLAAATTTTILWADPNASATGADGSKEHPFPTLLAACEAVPNAGGLIIAKEGTYKPGPNDEGVKTWTWNSSTGKGMIYLNGQTPTRILAEAGPEKTFITGRPDPTTGGVGANAVQGGFFEGATGIISGFTLTGLYGSSNTLTSPWWTVARNLFYVYTDGCDFTDCIVSNNVAAGHVLGGRLYRTTVCNNTASLGVVSKGATSAASVIYGNTVTGSSGYIFGTENVGSVNTKVYFTSVANNSIKGPAFEDATTTFSVNTALTTGGGTLYDLAGHFGCVYDGFKTWQAGDYLKADPAFVDPAKGDLRLLTVSPAVNYGVKDGDANDHDWLVYAPWDVNGNMVAVDAEGNVTPGAITERVPGAYVSAGQGGIEVVGGKIGVNMIDPANPLIVRATAGTRPVAGVVVTKDGVATTNLFETLAGHQYVLDEEAYVDALYLNRWYAAPNGDDAALGYYPSCAKTLQGAMTAAVSGDTVMAVKGTYNTGTMIQPNTATETYTIPSRVVVKAGVTLVSESGRDETVIEGAAATEGVEDETHGLGDNAVRGVFLTTNSKVAGFTIKKGHTRNTVGSSGADLHSGAETTGGGVRGEARANCVVEDCILQDNAAFRGGNAFGVTLNGCISERGYATYIGGGASDCNAYNSASRNNVAGWPPNGFAYMAQVESCTLLDSFGMANANSWLKNSVTKDTVYVSGRSGSQFANCVCAKNYFSGKSATFDSETDRVVEIPLADFGVDENGQITTESSAYIVDKADATLDGNWTNDRDAFGVQRVYNGVRDIGASEADWRAVYSKDLHDRRVTVVEASPEVMESKTAVKTLVLADGAQIDLTLNIANTLYEFEVGVPEGGMVTVKIGDEEARTYTSSQKVGVKVPTIDTIIAISYSGTGSATVGGFASRHGTYVIFY